MWLLDYIFKNKYLIKIKTFLYCFLLRFAGTVAKELESRERLSLVAPGF